MARTRRRRRWWQWSREGGRHIEAPLPWTTLPPFPSNPTARGGEKKPRRTMQKGQKRDCCSTEGPRSIACRLGYSAGRPGEQDRGNAKKEGKNWTVSEVRKVLSTGLHSVPSFLPSFPLWRRRCRVLGKFAAAAAAAAAAGVPPKKETVREMEEGEEGTSGKF